MRSNEPANSESYQALVIFIYVLCMSMEMYHSTLGFQSLGTDKMSLTIGNTQFISIDLDFAIPISEWSRQRSPMKEWTPALIG